MVQQLFYIQVIFIKLTATLLQDLYCTKNGFNFFFIILEALNYVTKRY